MSQTPGVIDTIVSEKPSLVAVQDDAHMIHTLVRWADCGLPTFDLTQGLMAALLLTDPGDVDASAVRLPFTTFAVRLPAWTLGFPRPGRSSEGGAGI